MAGCSVDASQFEAAAVSETPYRSAQGPIRSSVTESACVRLDAELQPGITSV